jgi:hypothetical protein
MHVVILILLLPLCASQPKDRFRWNLLNAYPVLRSFFAGDFFPEILNHRYIKYIFALVVAILFIGPQVSGFGVWEAWGLEVGLRRACAMEQSRKEGRNGLMRWGGEGSLRD